MKAAVGIVLFATGLLFLGVANWLVIRPLPPGRRAGVLRRWVLRDLAESRDLGAIRLRLSVPAAIGLGAMALGLWLGEDHI